MSNEIIEPGDELQREEWGYGPHFIRRYSVVVHNPGVGGRELMRRLQEDINVFSPQQNACFTKSRGEPSLLAVGDVFDIRICGPNDGNVVVTEVGENFFSLHTLKGHPEAGEITFSIGDEGDGFRFRIESHARSRDMLIHLMYHTLGIGKYKQGETWTHFCSAVADLAGGEREEVQVTTYRCENDTMDACTFEELASPAPEESLERTKLRDRRLRDGK
jgi:hypothetical protein